MFKENFSSAVCCFHVLSGLLMLSNPFYSHFSLSTISTHTDWELVSALLPRKCSLTLPHLGLSQCFFSVVNETTKRKMFVKRKHHMCHTSYLIWKAFFACKVIYKTINHWLDHWIVLCHNPCHINHWILLCFYQNFYPWFNDSVLQPEELHLPDHKEDVSVCEPARTEKKEEENDSSVIVKIQASGILIFDVLYSTIDA